MFANVVIVFIFLLNLTEIQAQNLVLNPSFENGATCDGTTERIDSVDNWSRVAGKPAYINTNCALSKESKSFVQGMRLPPAAHQNVLAILKMDREGEFIQGRLQEKLIKDEQYIITMFARRPIQFCTTAIKEIGVILGAKELPVSEKRRFIDLAALKLMNNDRSTIDVQYEWQQISALYRAEGGEKFICIGNFGNLNQSILENKGKEACSYIFIDYVSIKVFEEINIISFNPNSSLRKGERMVLSEVKFEAGKAILKSESTEALNSLAQFLIENPDLKVEISSHCDNNLDANKGLTFTKARADKLKEYLIAKSVNPKQLDAKGKGSMQAVALNNNVKGRAKNNRIEIKIINL